MWTAAFDHRRRRALYLFVLPTALAVYLIELPTPQGWVPALPASGAAQISATNGAGQGINGQGLNRSRRKTSPSVKEPGHKKGGWVSPATRAALAAVGRRFKTLDAPL